jgi:hypothetical protein
MSMHHRWLRMALLVGAVALLAPSAARAERRWVLLDFGVHGLPQDTAASFRGLLRLELGNRLGASVSEGGGPCADAACALAAAPAGAELVIYGSLHGLGSKIIIHVSAAERAGGEPRHHKMTALRIEDLDSVAARIAAAIATGASTDATAALGNITAAETQPDRRIRGTRGFSVRAGGMTPLRGAYAETGAGVLFDLSYWFEARDLAVEPRVGVRFDAVHGGGRFWEVPIDAGVFYIYSRASVAPFIGGGLGVHYIHESRPTTFVIGDVLPAVSNKILEDATWGFAAYGRVGLMLLRTYEMRVSLTADYNIIWATVNGTSNPQSLTFGMAVIF